MKLSKGTHLQPGLSLPIPGLSAYVPSMKSTVKYTGKHTTVNGAVGETKKVVNI